MDAAVKDKWVAALRSGGYRQGSGQLRNSNNEFCCLGVLADIGGKCEWDSSGDAIVNGEPVSMKDEYYLLPEFAGMPLETQKYLATMNDGGASFGEIADYIEEIHRKRITQDQRAGDR